MIFIFIFILSFNVSCSKDADLFDDIVQENIEEELENEEILEEEEEEEETVDTEEEPVIDEDNTDTDQVPDVIGDKGDGSISWYTDFETVQWSKNGSASNGMWEVGNSDEVRTTNDARIGSQAIWLGDFTGHSTRNEIKANRLLDWGEHWIGFSIKVTEAPPSARTFIQFRNTRESGGVGDGVINPVTLRQGNSGQMYFQTSTVESNVEKIYETGASTGTQRHNFDYKMDEWVDIVIHWVLDPNDGILEIWANGKKVVNETGTTTYKFAHIDGEPYDGDIGVQMGLYWGSSNTPQGNAYYDEFKVWKGDGGTYEDVSPGGLSPN